jgi:hypothetical protein
MQRRRRRGNISRRISRKRNIKLENVNEQKE